MTKKIKVAIVGVGNCASSLVQGIEYYSLRNQEDVPGVMHANIGGYTTKDIEVVAAFDVDYRKVGLPLTEAIFQTPNCTLIFQNEFRKKGPVVQKGPILDGVSSMMLEHDEDISFRIDETQEPVDVVQILKDTKPDVLVNYLPVGSEQATRFYAQCCLDAGVAMVNCMPVFIASNPVWAEKFKNAGLPIIGDDIKSQVGATIVHRMLARLFGDRGYTLNRTSQDNLGGNSDFLNMLELSRLKSKKISKTQSVVSQIDVPMNPRDVHIGPSGFNPWLKDNKIAHIRMEGTGFGGAPIEIDMKMSVIDSPNSAGVVMDAIRFCKLGLDNNFSGPLFYPSAFLMKSPPIQMRDSVSIEKCSQLASGLIVYNKVCNHDGIEKIDESQTIYRE